ncbi:MAG TPA: RNB domain-containing ribonuclease [Polyangiaceae bacterium]|jgi:exoribonuclease-2|nr:RNB domain-containing ribonuclease [Polyangiaceae bacterium]
MSLHGSDAAALARIAEEVMRELKFVPHPPNDALRQASDAPETPGPGQDVRDMRDVPWTSIDNPESRDLDQIEAVEPLSEGTRLLIGIADVDALVPKNSPIDRFAAANTTSVYTGVRTFPMLPERLSFDITSLLEGQPRFAMVYETVIGKDGSIGPVTVSRARVRNGAKLDYPSVSAWLDGTGPMPRGLASRPELQSQVRAQDELARSLAQARKLAGAIDVDTEETRPVMENGIVTGLVANKQDRAGRIIEELMVASNFAIARSLDAARVPSIRRVVKQPERWAKIVTYAGERGVKLPAAPSSIELARFVDTMRRERPDEFAEISLSIVKLMGRGEYVAHAPGAREIGHFGLATMEYTHSTAPNRRFVDLVTQRLIKSMARGASYSLEQLADVAAHASEREVAAQKVERRVRKSAAASLLRSRVGQKFEGVVTGAEDKGTFVRMFNPPAEGKLVEGARGLRVGDRVTVTLRDTNVERGFIDFAL